MTPSPDRLLDRLYRTVGGALFLALCGGVAYTVGGWPYRVSSSELAAATPLPRGERADPAGCRTAPAGSLVAVCRRLRPAARRRAIRMVCTWPRRLDSSAVPDRGALLDRGGPRTAARSGPRTLAVQGIRGSVAGGKDSAGP